MDSEEFFAKKGWEWGYFSFRPGIKRLHDYNLIGGYKKFKNELDIGVEYKKEVTIPLLLKIRLLLILETTIMLEILQENGLKEEKVGAPTGLKRLWKHLKSLKF